MAAFPRGEVTSANLSVVSMAPTRREISRATLQQALLGVNGEIVGQINHQTTPAGLVAGSNAGTIVTMEVLIKQEIILPVWVVLEGLLAAKDRP